MIAALVLYALVIVLLLALSRQILLDISTGKNLSGNILIPIILFIPGLLAIALIYQGVKLFRDRKRGVSGTRFKIRILIYFVVIVLFAGLPQGILSTNLINTAITYWFAPEVKEALSGGIDIGLQYVLDRQEMLLSAVKNPVLQRLASGDAPRLDEIWLLMKQNYPQIRSIQVFDIAGESVFFEGDENAFLQDVPAGFISSGMLPRTDYRSLIMLRGGYVSGDYRYVLTSILAENFDETAKTLEQAKEAFIQMDRYKDSLKYGVYIFYMMFSLPLFLMSIIVALLLSEEIVSPVVNLESATKRVADGDFSFRILGKSADELSFLVDSFNAMVSQLEKSRYQTLQTDKLSAWQEIAQRMAHEVKNPLTPIKLSAERILKKFYANEDLSSTLPRAAQSIIKEVENMNMLIQEFRDFSRTASLYQTKENINKLIKDATHTYSASYPRVKFEYELKDELYPYIDAAQINRVLANLIINAAEAMREKGVIYLRTDLVRKGNNEYCRIQVQDTGPGIAEDLHNQVFNPYYTTKKSGTGLGLPIIERIVFDHAGSIWFESEEGVGTTFFIDLPMEDQR